MKAEESMDKPATDMDMDMAMAKCHTTLAQWGYESELNDSIIRHKLCWTCLNDCLLIYRGNSMKRLLLI